MKRILLLFIILTAGSLAFGQHKHGRDYYDYRFRMFDVERPAFELSYGISNIKLDGYQQSFDNTALIDFKIGFSTNKTKRYYRDKLKNYEFAYLDIGNYSSELELRDKTAGKIKANNWRFGAGRKSGYMIETGSIGILPYTSSAILWTNTNWKELNSYSSPVENDKLYILGNQFRFGRNYESGLSIQVSRLLSFDLTYERSNVYPRYLFWKQTGSMLIQEAGIGFIDYFVSRVMRHQPVAGSIVNFVLKSAYYYGFNELKSKEMNWPFGGDASLNYSTFKFGLGFTF